MTRPPKMVILLLSPPGPVPASLTYTHMTELSPLSWSLISKYLHICPWPQLVIVLIFRSEWLSFGNLAKGRPLPQESTKPEGICGPLC